MRRVKRGERKNNKKLNLMFIILAIAYLIITGVFVGSVLNMDLLPGKYVLIFCLVELIITLLIVIGLAKKHKTYKLNVVCLLLAIVLSAGYMFATKYVNATDNFIKNMFKEKNEVEEYYVLVRNDSTYSKIEDLANKEIQFFQIEDDVKTEISSKVKVDFEKKDSLSEIGNNLINKKTDAIAISLSQNDMLKDEIKDFETNTRIIYTAIHEIEEVSTLEDENSKFNVENNVFNIYISGIDTSGNINNVARSDANIVVSVNTKTHQVLLTSIPRDYYVTLHSKHAKDKLTHSGIYGINETVTTVEDLLDIDISYYVRVNFTTVIKLVDVLDGVDVDSEYSFSAQGYNFRKGINHLNGKAALAFSRERHSFASGDNQRVKNQQAVISAIIDKITSSTTILTKYTTLLNSLEGSFQTNMDQSDISKIVKDQLDTMPSWTISSYALVGSGAYKSTYSMGSQELYVMIPDSTSVEKATTQINEILTK